MGPSRFSGSGEGAFRVTSTAVAAVSNPQNVTLCFAFLRPLGRESSIVRAET